MRKLRVLHLTHPSLVPPEDVSGLTDKQQYAMKTDIDVVAALLNLADPPEISEQWIDRLARQNDGWLMIDDAHGFGVLGSNGTGTVDPTLNSTDDVQILMGTLGKAFGTQGAFVAGTEELIETLIQLKPEDEWRFKGQEALLDGIRDGVGEIPGVLTNFTQPIQMSIDELLEGVRAELAIKLFGDDLEELKRKADEIASAVRRVRGAADVQADQISGTPQLRILVDRHALPPLLCQCG